MKGIIVVGTHYKPNFILFGSLAERPFIMVCTVVLCLKELF